MESIGTSNVFFGGNKATSTGAVGSDSKGNSGELGASQNVFGTDVPNNSGAPGTPGGQGWTDPVSNEHTAYSADSNLYGSASVNSGTSPDYSGIEGQTGNKTTGAGEGTPGHVHGWSK